MMEETTSDEIKQTGHAATDALIGRVRKIPGGRALRTWLVPTAAFGALIIAMIVLESVKLLDMGWPALVAFVLIFGTAVGYAILAQQRDMRAIAALAACKEMRVLGGLLEAVNYSDRRTRDIVEEPLAGPLQHVTEEHAVLLHMGDREALNALLYNKSGTLALAGLIAFPIGTLINAYILFKWFKPETKAWFGI